MPKQIEVQSWRKGDGDCTVITENKTYTILRTGAIYENNKWTMNLYCAVDPATDEPLMGRIQTGLIFEALKTGKYDRGIFRSTTVKRIVMD
jgi:hypothetical protein